jgi:hypothetical protein
VVAELDRIKAELALGCADVEMEDAPILEHLSKSYTMQEERNLLGGDQQETHSGDVELF